MGKLAPKKKMMNGKKSNQIGISKTLSKKKLKKTIKKGSTSPKTIKTTNFVDQTSEIKGKKLKTTKTLNSKDQPLEIKTKKLKNTKTLHSKDQDPKIKSKKPKVKKTTDQLSQINSKKPKSTKSLTSGDQSQRDNARIDQKDKKSETRNTVGQPSKMKTEEHKPTETKGQPSEMQNRENDPKSPKTMNKKKSNRRGTKRSKRTKGKKTIDYEKRREMGRKQDKKLMKKYANQVTETSKGKKTPKVDPTELVDLKLVEAAVAGLRKLPSVGTIERKSLHDITDTDERYVYLQVTLCKLPKVTDDFHLTGPSTVSVYLPNSLVTDNTDVILITKDLQRGIKRDHQNSLNHFKELLHNSEAASLVNEVIPLRQLKVEYNEYEAKRLLANRTDVLLCDDTIMRFIPKFLTKHFYSKKKVPVQVNLKAKDLQHELLRALSVSRLFFSMKGNSSIMKIGRMNQTDEELKENILAAVEKLATHAPGKWINIQGLSLKLEKTTCIPIFVKMDSMNTVPPIPARTIYPGKPVTGTLSTLPGRCVTVFPDGSVTVNKIKKSKDRLEDEDSDITKSKEPESEKSGKKNRRRKKSSASENKEAQKDEMEDDSTEKEKEEKTTMKETKDKTTKKRKPVEKKNSKTKKQKKSDSADSDSEVDELEEHEMMYLRQLKQTTGDQEEEEEDSEEDIWADSESDMEDSD